MSIYFAEKSWPEIADFVKKNALIILPFGTVEEHGLHLPVNTDLVIAEEVSKSVALAIKDKYSVLVLPGFWSGYSIKKMQKWPGVIRVRSEVLIDVFFDIMNSLVEMGFKRLLCINAHGQNPEILKLAARRIADEYDIHIVTSNCYSLAAEEMKKIRKSGLGGALHGGEFETSLMLYLTDLVDMSKTTREDVMKYQSEFYPGDMFGSARGGAFFSTWYVQESKTGIYGDPTVAAKETGELLLKSMVKQYVKLIDEYMNL